MRKSWRERLGPLNRAVAWSQEKWSGGSMNKIIIIGNCQAFAITQIAGLIAPNVSVSYLHRKDVEADPEKYRAQFKRLGKADHIISQPLSDEILGKSHIAEFVATTTFIPPILFQGYHPDCIYLDQGKLKSPIGDYHSALITACFKLGKSETEAYAAFNAFVFDNIGFFDFFEREKQNIKSRLAEFNLDIANDIDAILASGKMMHTVNHPTLRLLDEFTKSVFRQVDIPFKKLPADQFVADNFINNAIFPVYPEIAERLGLPGAYYFKRPINQTWPELKIYSLQEFIAASYEIYRNTASDQLTNPRLTPEYIAGIDRAIAISSEGRKTGKTRHPYKEKPDYCFWKKSISCVPAHEVDPVVSFPFKINKAQKIATAGSCFAQHIGRELSAKKFNYYVVEKEAEEINIFSARYGNIYTVRQLLQLFDRAFGQFSPALDAWSREDGMLVDPFRPQVVKNGFSDKQSLIAARDQHLDNVKRMFESLDIFVFTLGLTEAWAYKEDGAILPIAPGVVAGTMDHKLYDFINFQYAEIKKDLDTFIKKLNAVNQSAKITLTVSPVPLVATYENRHVLQSTTASKSILRAVSDEISRQHDNVGYFPSYEIITGNFNRGAYYAENLREVNQEGVSHVMKLFMKHCTIAELEEAGGNASNEELAELGEIICDEENLHVD